MPPITNVIFDVGRVLFRWDLRFLFEKLIADEAQLDHFLTHVVTPEWHFQADAGARVADLVAQRIIEFPEQAELIHAYAERFNETIPGPVAGSLKIVEELAANNVPLFAITNFGEEFWEGFRPTQKIFDHFRDIVVSGTEKMMKPDPAIYALALRRFGIAPGTGIFIDDNLDNVVSARENGFVAHHFTDAATLRTELVELGLLK